jgi:hypothetical protein
VNVNEAVARVRVVFVQTIEPKNSRRDQVLGRRKWIVGLERDAALKNCPGPQAVSDFRHDSKIAGRRFIAALFHTEAEPGG